MPVGPTAVEEELPLGYGGTAGVDEPGIAPASVLDEDGMIPVPVPMGATVELLAEYGGKPPDGAGAPWVPVRVQVVSEIGTELVFTTVLLAGQLVTVGAHDVMVNSVVE